MTDKTESLMFFQMSMVVFIEGKWCGWMSLMKSREKRKGKWSLCMVQIHLGTWADYLEREQDVMLMARKRVRGDLCCVKMQYNLVSQCSLPSSSFLGFSPLLSTCLRLGIKNTVLGEGWIFLPIKNKKGRIEQGTFFMSLCPFTGSTFSVTLMI